MRSLPKSWPGKLEPFRTQLESMVRSCTYLIPVSRQKNKAETLFPWDSNFCGLPYLHKGKTVPLDQQGNPMFMVVQIHFTDIPFHVEGFPQEGIVQLWISDEELEESKVIWIKAPQKEASDLITIEEYQELTGPFQNYGGFFKDNSYLGFEPCAMVFEKGSMLPSILDRDGDSMVKQVLKDQYDTLWEAYFKVSLPKETHWLAGFGRHGQRDPRDSFDKRMPFVHLGTDHIDGKNNICWGDAGNAGWFATPKEISSGKFKNVLFYWDN